MQSLDQIKSLLAYLEENEVEPTGEDADLIAELNRAAAGELSGGTPAATQEATSDEVVIGDQVLVQKEVRPGEVSLEDLEAAFLAADGPDEETSDPAPIPAPAAAVEPAAPATSAVKENAGPSIANQSIRVNVDVLEDLMTMVSELVLTRNQLMQMVRNQEDSEFKGPLQRLSGVTTDLRKLS